MESRLVPQARYTPKRLRELGAREVGRIGSILFVKTAGPLVLIHVTALAERDLDRYGLDRARSLIDDLGHTILNTADLMGLRPEDLAQQLARDGWVQPSRQLDAPRKGANKQMKGRA